MRTYGRTTDMITGVQTWVEVSSNDQQGDDYVWLTTLAQNLLGILGESPFYANCGIPAQVSMIQQLLPDYYVSQVQARYSPYFANLMVSRRPDFPPTYDVNVMTNAGVRMAVSIPI